MEGPIGRMVGADPESLAGLEAKLPKVLAGASLPKNAAEPAELAAIASTKMFHAAAALLYTGAFAEQPWLAGSPITGRRYNAARSNGQRRPWEG